MVTGAASGIGAALAGGSPPSAPRALVVADLDPRPSAARGEEIGGLRRRRPTSARGRHPGARPARPRARRADRPVLLERRDPRRSAAAPRRRTRSGADLEGQRDGARLGGPGRAARRWWSAGEGYLLSTASAAGLLTQVSRAAYTSPSTPRWRWRNGWRSPTATPGSRSRACARWACARRCSTRRSRIRSARRRCCADELLEPADVAEAVIAGIRDERFLILPHPKSPSTWRSRAPTTSAGCAGCGGWCVPPAGGRQSRDPEARLSAPSRMAIGAAQHLVGDAEGVDQRPASPRTSLQSLLTSRVIALQRGAGQPAVLLEEAPVGLEFWQRVEVAEAAQRVLGGSSSQSSTAAANASSMHRVDVRAGGVDGVVLDGAEHLERVVALVDPAPEALGDRGGDVPLAPAEQLELVLAVEQVAVSSSPGARRRRSPARSCARTAARPRSRPPGRRRM